jgi:hypothetical protein
MGMGGDVMFSKKRFFLGSLAIFLLGSAFHFLFDACGGSVLAAPFFAVNESVWEHMKLLSTAALLWMIADYPFAQKSARENFFAARAIALPIGLLSIPMLFYFVEGSFGVENLFADIGMFLLASALYQFLAMRLEGSLAPRAGWNAAGIAVLAGIFALFAVFTFLPLHIPLFLDTPTGSYGIR